MLEKLDSTSIYTERKEAEIEAIKAQLEQVDGIEKYNLYSRIASSYSTYISDSTQVYLSKAAQMADKLGCDSLRIKADIARSNMFSTTGFYVEAWDMIMSVPRNKLHGELLVSYFNTMASLYHGLYSGNDEPEDFKAKYRTLYTIYRDSLLMYENPGSDNYLRNLEKKAARAGDFDLAREYNSRRRDKVTNPRSNINAKILYDRYAISYIYEHTTSGEAIDNLLESAIIEMENCNQDIASLLRVEEYLIEMNEIKAAKKISDYYYSSMQKFGSRNRRLAASDQTVLISNRVLKSLNMKNKAMILAFIFISFLLVIITVSLVKINKIRQKTTILNEKLMLSGDITKGYIGVLFQLNSSYIKRMETFRSKIHMTLKKGNVEKALELTSLSGYVYADEIKELNNNFDSVFLRIYPNFMQTVNSCLKSEARFAQKSGMLSTELRIIALTKLGIDDTAELADMLRCSVKTIYNLRSSFKAKLAVSEEEFKKTLAEL